MSNPMTPTEQAKELREKVAAIIEYWDFSSLQDEDTRIERLKNEIMQLITTLQRQHERELVEARIDENNMYIKETERHYFPSGLNEPHIPLVQFYERISELTNNQKGEK